MENKKEEVTKGNSFNLIVIMIIVFIGFAIFLNHNVKNSDTKDSTEPNKAQVENKLSINTDETNINTNEAQVKPNLEITYDMYQKIIDKIKSSPNQEIISDKSLEISGMSIALMYAMYQNHLIITSTITNKETGVKEPSASFIDEDLDGYPDSWVDEGSNQRNLFDKNSPEYNDISHRIWASFLAFFNNNILNN
ncbi:MAG: hypothetical protein NTZ44_01930 [Candidatus Nomurabacteria bacterium]|nr:hypothetical protein [Candidatus Nomurabacteria bacterium]